ncbi:hypothetical protein A2160_04230 [Candidatus Beckwithbacteria bacterium RBG_13_42_9]|uniref:Thioredoxin domain-containing protein n=1 Tax=Candidatus Beckwithbacteria bacterium RBG_13_42_9 TaxID=1797457 RepID=A0A1F5E6E3_9BACT|nr:MAG: hypothetical protein A2160_04230 [Candidatus Beckwithbacteria bacterium RBG_13_42_9]
MDNKIVAVIVGLVVMVAFLGGRATSNLQLVRKEPASVTIQPKQVTQAQPQANQPAVLGASDAKDLADGGIAVKGNQDAKVTIVEVSDPSCPYCGAADGGNQQVINSLKSKDPTYVPAIPAIVKDYVETGKVKLVYRYYPGHGTGEKTMQALYCAVDSGKFWDFLDKVFQNQAALSNLDANFDSVLNLADEVGLDKNAISDCVTNGKYQTQIQKDQTDVQTAIQKLQLPGFGTPAFFVNGQYVGGAVSYPNIKQVIDQELAK